MNQCPLCDCARIAPGYVNGRLLAEYWPEDDRPDYLGLKRELEATFDLSLTVAGVKRHAGDHVAYSFTHASDGGRA